jgi:ABC-2 type transport system permease protein
MNRRLLAIIRKEYIHIIRDMRSLVIIILMPVLMIILYGYAITLDMKDIKLAVIDDAHSPESRELVRDFTRNGFFVLKAADIPRASIEQLFRRRAIVLALVIPKDFSRLLAKREPAKVQLVIDASDPNVATFINNYSAQVLRIFNERMNGALPVLLNIEPRIFYNPDMKSSNFFVPALIALILLLISALLTSITITREKETGTMEQILVSPIHPAEIIIGKVVPYIVIGFVNGALILAFAHAFFSVPVQGSLALIALLSLIYIFVALSFGLVISTLAKTQIVAMFITILTTILPTFMLSGFLFPISSMPPVLQAIARVIPATYFLIIIRGIMLKGIGLAELWQQAAILAGIGLFLVAVAIRRFKLTLD